MKLLRLFPGLIACLFVATCAKETPDNVRVLTYGSSYAPGHPFSRADIIWMEHVKEASDGSLVIRPYWSASLISEAESMTEIRHQVADIGLITPIYAAGGAHLLRTQTGFYSGVTGYEKQVQLFRCMRANHDPFAHELEGLKILAVQGGNNPGIVTTNKPVRALEDLKGMRIRAPSELLPVLASLDADPVDMPMGEVYSALAKGVIDGVVAPAETFSSLHFQEVSNFFTDLKVPRGAYPARAISLKTWDSLSDEHRTLLEASTAVWETALAEQTRAASDRGYEIGREFGIEYIDISPADQITFDQIYIEYAAKSADKLKRFGIEAAPVLEHARASVDEFGDINCKGPNT